MHLPSSHNGIFFQDKHLNVQIEHWANQLAQKSLSTSAIYEEDDSDSEMTSPTGQGHPNKYPVQIEDHDSKQCCYKRQITR